MDPKWASLLRSVAEVSSWAPDEIVFIGGIAVYLHAVNHPATEALAEATRDVDFYVSISAFSDLREVEEVVSNRRLSKQEFRKGDVSFDVYVQRAASLRVSYEEVAAHAVSYDGIRVASVEHLLVLKLGAYADRRDSAHGEKDARDLLRMAYLVESAALSFSGERVAEYLDEDEMRLLGDIVKGPGPMQMAQGNAQRAKQIRSAMTALIEKIKGGQPPPPAP